MSTEIPRDHLDRILRALWQRAPTSLLRFALRAPTLQVHGLLDSQPVLVRRGVDAVCEAEDHRGRFVGHVEAETRASAKDLPARMWTYGALLHASTGLPVRSSVLLLEPCPKLPRRFVMRHGQDVLATYRYDVVRLYQFPAAALAQNPDLAVLTPMGKGAGLTHVAAARDTLTRELSGPTRDDLIAALYIVGGRRFDSRDLLRIFNREQLMQSSTYKAILDEGFATGEQKGFQKGLQKGLQKGRESTLRAMTARQLHLRFPGSQLEPLLARCPTDDLEDFADLLVTASDLDTLSRWLVAHQGT